MKALLSKYKTLLIIKKYCDPYHTSVDILSDYLLCINILDLQFLIEVYSMMDYYDYHYL